MSTIEQLQSQLDQANLNLRGLQAQVEASKQMVNDGLNVSHQLRTNLIIFQQDNQDLARKNEVAQKQIAQLAAKILELSPPKVEPTE